MIYTRLLLLDGGYLSQLTELIKLLTQPISSVPAESFQGPEQIILITFPVETRTMMNKERDYQALNFRPSSTTS
jgi:hypothetical protein